MEKDKLSPNGRLHRDKFLLRKCLTERLYVARLKALFRQQMGDLGDT